MIFSKLYHNSISGASLVKQTSVWYSMEKCKGVDRMELRKGTMDDLIAVAHVEAVCFSAAEAAPLESFRQRLEVFSDCFWLLWEGETLVSMVNGMASDEHDLRDEMFHDANLHRPDGDWLMIFGVATVPEYQRQGCAAQVLNRAIEDSRTLGRKGVVLTCKDFRVPYYAKFGFVDEGISSSEHGGAVWHQMRITF